MSDPHSFDHDPFETSPDIFKGSYLLFTSSSSLQYLENACAGRPLYHPTH